MKQKYKLKTSRTAAFGRMLLCSLVVLMCSGTIAKAQLNYCAAANTDANASGSLMANVTFGSINNTTGSTYATNGYSYFPGMSTSVVLGTTENLTISTATPGSYSGAIISVWFDWNQNGNFETSEWTQVHTNLTQATSPFTFGIPIPATAVPGQTRMRIRTRGNGNPNGSGDACSSMGSGETEDYDIIVSAGTPCSGTPNGGNIASSVPDSVCPNVPFPLSVTGATVGTGMNYQWQTSPSGVAGSWTDITGATGLGYAVTAGINANTFYRLKSTCNSGTPVYSDEKGVYLKSWLSCYCTPTYTWGCSNGAYVGSFNTTGAVINVTNNNTGCASGAVGYSNYTAMQITAIQGTTFTSNTVVSNYSGGVRIWADWNHDGNFDPVTELCAASAATISGGGTFTATINVPATAQLGVTRFRVRVVESNTIFGPCDNFGYGETEDYTINVTAMPSCTTVTLPTTVTAFSNPSNLCVTGNVSLTTDTNITAATGLTYQWQSSPNNTTWTDIAGANGQTYAAINVTSTTYYRMQVKCNGTVMLSSVSDTVIVNNPGSVTTTPGTRCGPGSVALGGATVNPGASVVWYQNATGGVPLGAGNTFNTPYIPNTTTFYAAATSGSSAVDGWIGTGTSNLSSPNPYYTFFWGSKNQFLIRASDLIAAGFGAGIIQSISFNATGSFAMNLTGYEVMMKQTSTNSLTAWETGLTSVYTNPSYTPVSGVNTHTLTTPFVWDGNSNIVIQTCYNNSSWSSGFNVVGTTSLGYNAGYYSNGDNATVCSNTSGTTSTSRPNIKLNMIVGCEGVRVPAVATVTAGSPVTKTNPPVVCNNEIATVAVTLPTNGQYAPYKFYPLTDLYTNAAATTPYTGAAATTVYFKSSTSGLHTFYAVGGDTTAAATICSRADTFKIWVQPATNIIDATPDTICVSGDADLLLTTDTNFYPGSIQWQTSTNGTTYTNIAGASGLAYTTPVISTDHYYRVLISGNNGSICQTIDKPILVVNPQLVSSTPGERCGPGPVSLSAVPGTNAVIRWYDNPNGGLAVGQGNTFTTPSLNATTTYYVTSGTGAAPMLPTWIGTGTTSTTGTPTPFYTGWYGSKNQYLFKASELIAAGLSAGAITEIAFDVTSSTGLPLTGYNMSMKLVAPTVNVLTTTWETGMTPVYASATPYVPVANTANNFVLQTPIVWDGVSNIVIQTCFNNTSFSGSHGVRTGNVGFNGSHYYYADNSTVCTTGGTGYLTTTRPNVRFNIVGGCETPLVAVPATINPLPAVALGNDLDTCVDQGLAFTVDAAPQPNNATYLWDNGATTSTRLVDQSGVYHVAVTNSYGCVGHDTLNISIKDNPVVDLGANGTTFCIGGVKTLDAGPDGENGGTYYWNTGAITRTIVANGAGTYIAFVTSPEGCLKVDTVEITVSGNMPQTDGILSTALNANTFQFTTSNPVYAVGYVWDFGDGSPLQTVNHNNGVSHSYAGNGYYMVKVKTNSTCGDVTDSMLVSIFGLGVSTVNNDLKVKVYPNPSTTDLVTLETEGGLSIKGVKVYNMVGQEIYTNNKMPKNQEEHQLRLGAHLPAGIYNIVIDTDKGLVSRKLELLK